jgi:hypothetical protein
MLKTFVKMAENCWIVFMARDGKSEGNSKAFGQLEGIEHCSEDQWMN